MGDVINLRHNCTGECETPMGCACHPASIRYRAAAPAAPDQPLITQPGDLGERHTPPEGRCWICTAVWLIAVGLAAGMLWFAVRQIINGAT